MAIWQKHFTKPITSPLTATGRSNMPCMPRMADCGGLMMGVPISEPKTPPLLIVKVPPSISSTARSPFFAYSVNTASTRSSATAERQRVSYTRLSRLTHWSCTSLSTAPFLQLYNRLAKLVSTLAANKPCDIRTLSWIRHSRSSLLVPAGIQNGLLS